MAILAVVGSRSITDQGWVFSQIAKLTEEPSSEFGTIISGGAKGIDTFAREYADKFGYAFVEFLPYHLLDKTVTFSPKYFFVRNKQIISNADHVLALWNGESTGTQHAIRYAQKLGIPVTVVKHVA